VTEVQFARVDGNQLFVRSDDVEAVLAAIEDYVAQQGCSGMFEAVDDRIGGEGRSERKFALSQPERGWITVWEDGSSADRRLAQFLSGRLVAPVHWLMVSSSTDSWAHGQYADGEQRAFEYVEDVDAPEVASRYAAQHDLPHALRFMRSPNVGGVIAGMDQDLLKSLGIDPQRALKNAPGDPGPDGMVTRAMSCG
jgi:hypothetical protein